MSSIVIALLALLVKTAALVGACAILFAAASALAGVDFSASWPLICGGGGRGPCFFAAF